MNFVIKMIDENTISVHMRKNESGDIEIVGGDGKIENILFVIRKNGMFVRVPYVRLSHFRIDKEGRIEEDKW